MSETSLFEDLNNSTFWFIAILGLYLWGFTLCIVSGVRQAAMEQFDLIWVHRNLLICRCKQPPPSYEQLFGNLPGYLVADHQLYGNLPSYQEAVLLV